MSKLITLDTPRNPIIQINQETNRDVPQAWEHKWNWYYNWLGAVKEAKHRGLHLPSDAELYNLEDELLNLNQFSGFRYTSGSFLGLGSNGGWWSITESGNSAWGRGLSSRDSTVYRFTNNKGFGFSVVCTKKTL